MELSEQTRDGYMIIGINGRLDTTNYQILEHRLMKYIDENQIRLIIDCTRMDYISSSGLRIFLMALKRVSQAKGRFVICSLQDMIKEVFAISGFNSIFEVYPTVDEALSVKPA
jgi:anti-anti-sigma factor